MTTPAGSRVQPGGEPPNKGRKFPAEVLTPDEVLDILAETSGRAPTPARNKALIMLLYRSGLRVGEILSLRVKDVDLDHHCVRLLDTKSGQAQTAGFHPSADATLLRWMDKRKALGIRANGHPLFCTIRDPGEPMSTDYVRHMVRRLARKAGVAKRVHPHGFRHTYAVELMYADVPVDVISKLLRHKSIATTVRYLDHLTNGRAVEALQEVDLPEVGGERTAAEEEDDRARIALLEEQVAALLSRLDV